MVDSSGETSGGSGAPETEKGTPETPSTPVNSNVEPEGIDPYAEVHSAMQAAEAAVTDAVQGLAKLQNQQ